MKTKQLFIFLFISAFCCAQQHFRVINAETQQPVPYAKLILKDKDYYKNTEENGEATLEEGEDVIEIQSFGYDNLKVEKFQNQYSLKPKVIEIDEVTLLRPKFDYNFKIGSLKTYGGFGGGLNPKKPTFWGKVVTLDNNRSNEPLFVKSIKFKSISSKPSVVIKMLIFKNNHGLPGELLRSEEIICKSGHNKMQEFSPKNMTFPKEGIIVGFEWIINENNRIQIKKILNNNDKAQNVITYEPSLAGCKEEEPRTIIGSLINGEWHFQKMQLSNESRLRYNPAIQIELTN